MSGASTCTELTNAESAALEDPRCWAPHAANHDAATKATLNRTSTATAGQCKYLGPRSPVGQAGGCAERVDHVRSRGRRSLFRRPASPLLPGGGRRSGV